MTWLVSVTTAPHVVWQRADDYYLATSDPQRIDQDWLASIRRMRSIEHPDFEMPDLGYEP